MGLALTGIAGIDQNKKDQENSNYTGDSLKLSPANNQPC